MSSRTRGSVDSTQPTVGRDRRPAAPPRTVLLSDALDSLERTPHLLREWTQRLSAGGPVAAPHSVARSVREAVIRLTLAERRHWQPRIRSVLTVHAQRPTAELEGSPDCAPSQVRGDRISRFARLRRESLALLRTMQPTPDRFLVHCVHPEADPAALSQFLNEWVACEAAALHGLASMLCVAL
jgi:hypothetical protein